jgi:hypothetical protein
VSDKPSTTFFINLWSLKSSLLFIQCKMVEGQRGGRTIFFTTSETIFEMNSMPGTDICPHQSCIYCNPLMPGVRFSHGLL